MYGLPKLGRVLVVDDFRPHVGEDFLVQAEPEPVRLRLDAIDQGVIQTWSIREAFTLVFSTPFETLLVEGTYPFRMPRGDVVEIDLIPTQTMQTRRRLYHAVFT